MVQLQFSYPGQSGDLVIDIDHWQVPQGQRVFLSGESGSGKSTLLNLICGTLSPTGGNIELLQQPFSQLSGRKRDTFRAKHIGVVFQQFNLIPYLSVAQNIALAGYFGHTCVENINTRISTFLSRLELAENLLNQRADALSMGQQQRVAIARALINQPEILVVDEPTSALDAKARDSFIDLLLDCAAEINSTVIFVSHDQSLADHFDQHVLLTELNQASRQTV